MTQLIHPRRSVLYMPGSNARALEKARSIDADSLILDLEDAVSPESKALARKQVCEAASTGGYGHRELVIRINGLDTPWGSDDLAAAAQVKPAAILVPKVNSPAELQAVESALSAAQAAETKIWAMMETMESTMRAGEIAAAGGRLSVLVAGTNDLARELRAAHVPGRLPLMTCLQLFLIAARRYGLVILDGVYNDIKNAEGFEQECVQGLSLGFDGKTLIHPDQVAICNRVFSPTPAEFEQAQRVIAAFDAARREGKGVATVDGRMVENLHVDNARRVVALADAVARRDQAKT